MPDGTKVRFPDDMPREQIKGMISSKFPELASNQDALAPQGETGARRFVQQPLQGATFGFGEDVAGTLGGYGAKAYDVARQAVGKEPLFTESAGELAQAGRDKARADIKAQQEERPLESLALQLGGGIGTGVAGASTKAGQAVLGNVAKSGTLGKVAKSAGLGGAAGAIAGAGESEGDIQERLRGAASGSALGAAVGGVIPAVGGVFRLGKNVLTGKQADKQVAEALRQSIGKEDIVTGAPSGKSLEALRGELTEEGNILSLADVGGAETRQLLRSLSKYDGVQNMVDDYLRGRSRNAATRIDSLLSKKVSNVDNYFSNLDELANTRAKVSGKNYKEAFEQGSKLKQTQRLNTLVKDKRIADAIEEGKAEYGVSAEAGRFSIEALDGAKKVLDDKIGTAIRGGQSQKAKVFTELKKELVGEIDAQVPSYKKAREVFSGYKSFEDAQEAGLKFKSLDPEQIIKYKKGMTAGEHDAFLIGVRKSLQNDVMRAAQEGDSAKRIFGNPLMKRKIRAAFPDDKSYKEFSKRMQQELDAQETFNKVLGGSRTDFNQASDQELANFFQRAATTSPTMAALDTGVVLMKNRLQGINDKNARAIAKILIDKKKGIEALDKLIKQEKGIQAQILEQAKPYVESAKVGTSATISKEAQ